MPNDQPLCRHLRHYFAPNVTAGLLKLSDLAGYRNAPVYIRPYIDSNGRTGRFLMNVMMAAGGYPWTVIPVERRDDYTAALEAASAGGNIVPFADFIAELQRAE